MQSDRLERRDLTCRRCDTALLRAFYQSIYVAEFPDFNERESLENMERYLELRAEGWYGKNNYHILLYVDSGVPVAGSIIHYLSDPNVGVIEFLVVGAALRRGGLGSGLLAWTESVLHEDSKRAGHEGWTYVIAEMNDPFKCCELEDSMDPFVRPLFWDRWGYRKTRFPYVQP